MRQDLQRERERTAHLQARVRDLEDASAQLEAYAQDLSRTYGELRRHIQRMTALHEVTTRVASALDPREVLTGLLDSLDQIVTCDRAAIYLLDLHVAIPAEGPGAIETNGALPRLRATRLIEEGGATQLCEPEEASPVEEVVLEAVRRAATTSRARDGSDGGQHELGIPLRAAGRILGALYLAGGRPLPADEVRLLEMLSASAAVALQNAHLFQETQRLATTDPLTGLSNFGHFQELLRLEVERARRLGYAVGLLMLDLDHFKQVNDRYGHPAGNTALRQVAEVFRARLRRTDVVARLGGEEFAVLLPGASTDEVAVVAEKLRTAVADLPPLGASAAGGEGLALTVSVGGVAARPPELDAETLFVRADQALYEAKNSGRNQVRLRGGDAAAVDVASANDASASGGGQHAAEPRR